MSCGAAEQHQTVCLDVIGMTPITAATTACTITIRYSTSSVAWGFADPQTLTAYGQISAAWNFTMSTANGATTNIVVADAAVTVPVNYGSAGVYGFGAVISNQYLGGTPEHVINVTVPARPPSVPSKTSVSVSQVTQTSAYLTVAPPASDGGAGIDAWNTYVSTTPGLTNIVQTISGTGLVTGLTPGVTYYTAAESHNAAGWSGTGAVTAFTTIAGGRAKVGGAWVNAGSWAKVGGAWVRVVGVWKKVNGTWVK